MNPFTLGVLTIRLFAGVGAILAPGPIERAATGTTSGTVGSVYFARLFGIRDLGYAAGVIAAGSDGARDTWLLVGAVTDAFDLVETARTHRSRGVRGGQRGPPAPAPTPTPPI